MALSPAVLGLTTLSFCAAVAMLVGAYKAHNVLKSTRSIGFLTSFSLISIGLLLRLVVDTEFADGYAQAMQAVLGISNHFLLVLSGLALLSAYTLLLFVIEKQRSVSMQTIAAALIVVTTLLSTQYQLAVHAVTAVILALLAHRFYDNFLTKNSTEALIVYGAFLALTAAHVAALFAPISHAATILYLSLRLAGYFALFAMLWRVGRG